MKRLNNKRCLVVFSGGQDSTTCLGKAIKDFGKENVLTLCFDYGQKHSVELEVAKEIFSTTKIHSSHFHILKTDVMAQIGDSALVTDGDVNEMKDGLPTSFVPGRNMIFLTHAAQLAYAYDCRHIITGVCETDFSGYPDCRDNFVKSLQVAINLAMEADFVIHTPLMWLNKCETWMLAEDNDFLNQVMRSHTCYNGNRQKKNDWGFGCGECPACKVRANGYTDFIACVEAEEE